MVESGSGKPDVRMKGDIMSGKVFLLSEGQGRAERSGCGVPAREGVKLLPYARFAIAALALATLLAVLCCAVPQSAYADGDLAAGSSVGIAAQEPASASGGAVVTDAAAKPAKSKLSAQEFDKAFANYPDEKAVVHLALGQPVGVTLDASNDYVQWLAFSPVESGAYQFSSSNCDDDPFGALYAPKKLGESDGDGDGYDLERIAENDDRDSNNLNFRIKANLLANTTYYLACSNIDDGDDDYWVSVEEFDPKDLANLKKSWEKRIWLGAESGLATAPLSTIKARFEADDSNGGNDSGARFLEEGVDFALEGLFSRVYDDEDDEYVDTRCIKPPTEVGTYVARVRGIGEYHGVAEMEFRILDPYDIGNVYWLIDVGDVYDDMVVSESTLKISLEFSRSEAVRAGIAAPANPKLNSGYKVVGWYKRYEDDFEETFTYEPIPAPSNTPGVYQVELEGIGKYHGKTSCAYVVYKADSIDEYGVYWHRNLWEDGKAVTLDRLGVVVYRYGDSRVRLKYGVDYVLDGWYLGGDDVGGIAEAKRLASAPKEAGDYYVRLKGKGKYTGSTSFLFQIVDVSDIDEYTLEHKETIAYDGKPVTPSKLGLVLSRTDEKGVKTELAYGTDYEVWNWVLSDPDYEVIEEGGSLDEIVEKGTYRASVTGVDAYRGWRSFSFAITDSNDLSAATVSGVKEEYFLSAPIELKPVVRAADGTKLVAGKHYTVKIERWDNDAASFVEVDSVFERGDYRLVLSAIPSGGYIGSFDESFAVYPASERVSITSDNFYIDGLAAGYAYSGKPIKPAITVRSMNSYGSTLVQGVDYAVSYKDNVNPGTARVSITGIGAYQGALGATFKIKRLSRGFGFSRGSSSFIVTRPGREVKFGGSRASGKVKVPATVTVGGQKFKVTSIAARAFAGNKKMTALTVGPNVRTIGKTPLKGAVKVKTVTVQSGNLNKASIRNLVKGSKVKTVKLSGKAAKAKKALYQKYLGKRIKVK